MGLLKFIGERQNTLQFSIIKGSEKQNSSRKNLPKILRWIQIWHILNNRKLHFDPVFVCVLICAHYDGDFHLKSDGKPFSVVSFVFLVSSNCFTYSFSAVPNQLIDIKSKLNLTIKVSFVLFFYVIVFFNCTVKRQLGLKLVPFLHQRKYSRL